MTQEPRDNAVYTYICSMYVALKRLQEAENKEELLFTGNQNCATAMVEKVLARSRRRAKQALQVVEKAQIEAEKAAAEAERLSRQAAEAAQEQARQALEAAQAAALETQTPREMDTMSGTPTLDTSAFLDQAAQPARHCRCQCAWASSSWQSLCRFPAAKTSPG